MSNNKPVPVKGRKALKYRGTECLNCGHPLDLSDRYCSYCSQLNTNKSLSLKDFLGEFIGSVITYDSRFRYTLKDLLFKPGTITRNYVEGKRLRYANPFRFFLSVSISYFLLQGIIGALSGENSLIEFNDEGESIDISSPNVGAPGIITAVADSNDTLVPSDAVKLQDLLKDKTLLKGADAKRLDSILGASGSQLDQEEVDSIVNTFKNLPFVGDGSEEPSYDYISEEALDTLSRGERIFKRVWLYRNFYRTTKIEDPTLALDSLKHRQTAINRWIYSKNESLERIEKNPTAFFEYLLAKTPFFLFFFTPFFALFFWLLYYYKSFTYMEHMIFIFHVFSFVFLAALICLIPDTLIGSNIFFGIVFSLIGPFYFYKALRNFYRESRFISVLKFVLLNGFFLIGATLAAIIFFSLSAVLY
jgi:hypothetical protein